VWYGRDMKEIILSVIERAKRDYLIFRYQKEIREFILTDYFIYCCEVIKEDVIKIVEEITNNEYTIKNGRLRRVYENS
jgi:coenzyme F420-reducing hydrogenase gamma subunit